MPGSETYISLELTLAIMVGALQLPMGLLRFGALVNFISHSVAVGFTTGAARLIAVKQAKAFLGLDIPDTGHLIQMLEYLSTYWENFYPLVLPVSVVTLLTGLICQYRFPNKPVMIIALRAGSIATLLFNHTCQQRNDDRISFCLQGHQILYCKE